MAQIGEDARPSRPLNQEDLLGTLGTFTTATFDALAEDGCRVRRRRSRVLIYHLWNVVGWHLGIGERETLGDEFDACARRTTWPDNKIFPLAAPEMDKVFGRLRGTTPVQERRGRSSREDPRCRRCRDPLPGPLQGAPAFLVRYLIGDDLADELGDRGGWLPAVAPAPHRCARGHREASSG